MLVRIRTAQAIGRNRAAAHRDCRDPEITIRDVRCYQAPHRAIRRHRPRAARAGIAVASIKGHRISLHRIGGAVGEFVGCLSVGEGARAAVMRDYLIARLQEPSTWRGLVLIATACGAALSPDQQEAIVTSGLLVAGLIGAAFQDRKKEQ